MTCEQARERFESLNVWKRNEKRAPHKPLLLLLTLARIARGGDRLVPFTEVEDPLRKLLVEFGPPGAAGPHLPFWHLRTDGFWEIVGLPGIEDRAPGDTPRVSELRAPAIRAGLDEDMDRLVRADADCRRDLARLLLDGHFPESLHEEIAGAIGLDLSTVTPAVRDPRFRDRILIAYGYSCAVCGYNLRLQHAPVALEAAHIMWHQFGGPSTENNGLALCSMHHKLFDRGAMTVDSERRIVISPLVNGTTGLNDWLLRFHEKPLRVPRDPEQVPLEDYVQWHVREVFKGRNAAARAAAHPFTS